MNEYPPWTSGYCEQCGVGMLLTRAEPGPGLRICESCSDYISPETALKKELAELHAEVERLREKHDDALRRAERAENRDEQAVAAEHYYLCREELKIPDGGSLVDYCQDLRAEVERLRNALRAFADEDGETLGSCPCRSGRCRWCIARDALDEEQGK